MTYIKNLTVSIERVVQIYICYVKIINHNEWYSIRSVIEVILLCKIKVISFLTTTHLGMGKVTKMRGCVPFNFQ